ncbi:uncharacterized protein BX664DRAFT_327067 [Halteromyces radiatus]|uniref:uncharacterized protein n=1 Tax=Halteromyces radiatus TaxID=101107 RepID=UPI00221F190D|nr:uncharacterized protein BX664DRAFT_327067 [Halteromyces radiatus]KAI8097710.1 hypothetical protein BX664DRAFT_327067 [Halteromyces radiatus]
MVKLAKGISSSSLTEDWISLQVIGPFELSIILKTKPTRPFKIADYLARRGFWPPWTSRRQQRAQASAFYQQSTCWSSSSVTSSSAAAVAVSSLPSLLSSVLVTSRMTMTGYLDLISEDNFDLIENGQHRYRFSKTTSASNMNMELLVEFRWEEQQPGDRDLGVAGQCSPTTKKTLIYPWTHYKGISQSSGTPMEEEKEDGLLSNKDMVKDALSHITGGDYLTFYLHGGSALPKWQRYWVILKNNHLLLTSPSLKNKSPIYDLPLKLLKYVSKPTEEDQEYVCLNRKVGIVIQLDTQSSNDFNYGLLGDRMYILADTPQLALIWRRALTSIRKKNRF